MGLVECSIQLHLACSPEPHGHLCSLGLSVSTITSCLLIRGPIKTTVLYGRGLLVGCPIEALPVIPAASPEWEALARF